MRLLSVFQPNLLEEIIDFRIRQRNLDVVAAAGTKMIFIAFMSVLDGVFCVVFSPGSSFRTSYGSSRGICQSADVIHVINEGRIIESGTHSQLLHRKGFYYNLYMTQLSTSL
jgi:hypothetical protein